MFNFLEKNPIIDIQKTANALGLSYNTVAKAILLLIDKGILIQSAKSGKARIYSYFDYLDILRKDTWLYLKVFASLRVFNKLAEL